MRVFWLLYWGCWEGCSQHCKHCMMILIYSTSVRYSCYPNPRNKLFYDQISPFIYPWKLSICLYYLHSNLHNLLKINYFTKNHWSINLFDHLLTWIIGVIDFINIAISWRSKTSSSDLSSTQGLFSFPRCLSPWKSLMVLLNHSENSILHVIILYLLQKFPKNCFLQNLRVVIDH